MSSTPALVLTPRRRLLFRAILLTLLLLGGELLARVYLRAAAGGSLVHPDRVLYGFYPELGRLLEERGEEPDDDAIDILLLGGSALNSRWGAIEAVLAERLSLEQRRRVRMYNLAKEAHTTRDSLLKYKRVGERRFDLVMVYHGINDARTNNAPRKIFRDDYGHYSWYRFVNAIDRDRWLPYLALPYAVRHGVFRVQERLGMSAVIPTDEPREEWTRYGSDVKSAGPFRDNLSAIVDLAATRHEPILLMTFATHLPANYSREAFASMQLDYTRHRSPLWWWGTPEAVRAAVDAHNQVVRALAASRGTPLVDQAALIPGERRYYNDVCHLTVAGSELFVDNLLPTVRGLLASPVKRP